MLPKEKVKQAIIFCVEELEGGFDVIENNEHDEGGLTRAGIASKFFPNIDLKNLTHEEIIDFHYENFFKQQSKYESYPNLMIYAYWTATNTGNRGFDKNVQKTINDFRKNLFKLDEIEVDGLVGPITIKALNDIMEYLKKKSPWNYEFIFIKVLEKNLIDHYITRKTALYNFPGWINRLDKQYKELEKESVA